MKTLLWLAFSLLSFSSFALEKQTVVKCKNGNCKEETIYSDLVQRTLRYEDYVIGQCLVDLSNKQSPQFYQVREKANSESRARSIVLLKEVSVDANTKIHILENTTLWNKDLERLKLSNFPCDKTSSFFEQSQLETCLSKHKLRYNSKVYCEIK